ncbi:MAG: LuxR C-terminal-related transcriptional regulator [Anaerolineae bacterium]
MVTRVGSQILQRTKLHRPRVTADLVQRPQLKALLDESLDRSLILVAAPAGFGKSTLVSAWLETSDLPYAWLSLDPGDNTLAVFLAYFVSAIRSIFPDSMAETRASLVGVNLPPVDVMAASLINEMDGLDRDFILVLDDFHAIHDQAIHDLLSTLLQHPPQHMRLVILTRRDPPIHLGLLRARNQVAEVRASDLRFSASEVAAFVERTLGAPLAAEAVAVLAERTEGWAAGLRLATLTLRYGGDADSHVVGLHAERHFVVDYLISEVLASVPPAIKSFLLKTPILDQMSAPLCEAVIGPASAELDVQACLEWLEANELFTVALDAQGQWYRYHHLFQEFLLEQLMRRSDAEEIAALHSRASGWFARHGYLEEALRHALAGQDTAAAVRVMAEHRHALMDAEDWQRLERLLGMFSAETVATHLDLLLTQAALIELGRAPRQQVKETVERAAELVAQMVDEPVRAAQLAGEIDTFRAVEATESAADPEHAVTLAQRALAAMPRSWHFVREVAWLRLALAHQTAGRLSRAYAALAEGQLEDMAQGGPVRTRLAGWRCFVMWIAGDLPAIPQAAEQMRAVGEMQRRPESLGWGHYLLASVAYALNDLAIAEAHARAVEDMRYLSRPVTSLQSALIYASICQARGQPDQARQKLDLAFEYLRETRSTGLVPLAQAFQAELAARQGDVALARHWATAIGPFVPLTLMPYFYAPQLTLPKILLLQDSPASREQAAAVLSRLRAFVTATHNTRFTIEVLALQALLHDAQGDERMALVVLKQAVSLAEAGGFIRLFVDLGPRMASLLARLRERGVARAYVGRVLQAFGELPVAAPSLGPANGAVVSEDGPVELIEPLTEREREVLALLAQRLTNKEIAGVLMISVPTVKRHTHNILEKLQAANRRDAVAVAIRLSLL